jgi:5'-nucleotidase
MGYDAATMGNHDFDNGLEGFDKQLPHANFPFVCSNYDFDKTILKDKTKKYHIIEKGGLKIGIIGLGIEMEGLISKKNYGETVYYDPIEKANEYAAILKEKNCDFIVCISHLGYNYEQKKLNKKISDVILASKTRYIDYIIGGHTHTFLEEADEIANLDGKKVLVSQSGWGGILLGRLDIMFSKGMKEKLSLLYTSKKVRSQV